MYVYGKITDTKGNAIPGAIIETWETDSHGMYDNQVRQLFVQVITVALTNLSSTPTAMDQTAEAESAQRQMVPILIELWCMYQPLPISGPLDILN